MSDPRSWFLRANDFALARIQKLEGQELSLKRIYDEVRAAFLQGAFEQYNEIESEWAEEHPNPVKGEDAIRHRT